MIETEADTSVLMDDPAAADEVNAWLFFRSLKASKLLPLAEVEALERRAMDESLAAVWTEIRGSGLLTEYQFARIASGNPEGLVYGHYHVLGELGRGGCGAVYRAKHPLMDRVVALKVIAPELNKDVVVRDLFLREVLATTRLSHPHIAAAFHADVVDDQTFLVMEYIDGPTLHMYVSAGGPLPIPLACSVLHQTAQALQHAHENGLIHRDIKPANILLSSGGSLVPAGDPRAVVVKVIDFGLARHRSPGRGVLATIPNPDNLAIGTPAFIAPEQIDDVHAADARADIYSLGCTMYFALTGRLPFPGVSAEVTLYLHQQQEPTPIRSHRASVPERLAAIVERMMAKDPAARYQSASELLAALNEFLRPPVPIELPTVKPAAEPTPPPVIEQANHPAPRTLAEWRGLWEDWSSVVGGIAWNQPLAIADDEYKALYRELVAALRTDGADSWLAVVEPWVSLHSLAALDRHSLGQLWHTCQAIGPEPSLASGGKRGGAIVAFLIGVAVLAALWFAVPNVR